MLLTQVIQSAVLPLLIVLLITGLIKRGWGVALGVSLAVAISWLWIRGWSIPLPLRAVDLVALSTLISSGMLAVWHWGRGSAAGVPTSLALLTVLLLWSSRMLWGDWGIVEWSLAVIAPVVTLLLGLWLARDISVKDAANTGLALLAYLPMVIAIGGSLLMGQLAGLLAASFGGIWLLLQFKERIPLGAQHIPAQGILILALLPSLMLLVVAWQFAEISLSALILGLLLPAVYLALAKAHKLPEGWLTRHVVLAVALGVQLGIGLWLVWPEQSLY